MTPGRGFHQHRHGGDIDLDGNGRTRRRVGGGGGLHRHAKEDVVNDGAPDEMVSLVFSLSGINEDFSIFFGQEI